MSHPSKVWFIPVDEADTITAIADKLRLLFDRSGFSDAVSANSVAQIKMHFGEKGNRGYVRPELIRGITDAIRARGGRAVVSDTNTLYRGGRTNSRDHLQLARRHGFTDEAVGGGVEIPDEKDATSVASVPVAGRFIAAAKVLRCYIETPLLVGVAHFKGHLVTGFGGALKNIGMGCATREGKLAQHAAVAPFIIGKNCIGCGACRDVCPADAITVIDGKARLDPAKCIGCASCIAVCKNDAVELDWRGGTGSLPDKMVEYAAAVLGSPGQKVFINVALRITAECDCLAKDDPRIVPDVGLFAATDPAAIDQASYDLVCTKAGGFDPFRKAHPKRDPVRQLDCAERMGLGTRNYELVTVGQ
ncbi:MAG: DUF362 domain-containing protein [Chitinispirillaceae bacterium]|nr:DUF362 domain-containing protein [Chitinispirillaceae bacterium]